MGLSSQFLTQNPVLLILAAAPTWLAGIALAVSFQPAVYKRIEKWRLPLAVGLYILTRFVLFYVIYVLFSGQKVGVDLPWFQWEGEGALAGKIPYRDFRCAHAPLFPYLMAIPYGIWDYRASSILLFILFDLVTLILLCKISRRMLGPDHVMDTAWIYVINPATWVLIVRCAQDESVVSAFLLLAVYLYMIGSSWWNPVVMALGVLFTKFTTAVGMAVVYAYSKTKVRDAFTVAGLVVLVCAPFYLKGADLLWPVTGQTGWIDGVSIPSVLNRLVVPPAYHLPLFYLTSIAAILGFGIVLYTGHRRGLPMVASLTACLLIFLVFIPKSYKQYRYWCLGPLGLHAQQTRGMSRFALYSTLLCTVDECSFRTAAPAISYIEGAIMIAILYFEVRYVLEILNHQSPNASRVSH